MVAFRKGDPHGGEYHGPAAPDSNSEIIVKLGPHRAFGVLNGIETGVVVTVTSAGGTGTFHDLALLSRQAGGWVNTDVVFLGDRVNLHAVKIDDNAIVIDMTIHGPDDPMCCPAHRVLRRFSVMNGHLVSAGEITEESDSQITGPAWHWVQTLYSNGKRSLPSKPENFTVQFLENGKVNVKADCNLKAGKYSTDGKSLSIELTHSTMASCEEGSLEDQFVIDLTASADYFFKDGYLYIDMKYDTGTMKFKEENIWKE